MELQEIQNITSSPKEVIKKIQAEAKEIDLTEVSKYYIKNHDVLNHALRPNNKYKRAVKNADGDVTGHEDVYTEVTRIPAQMEKYIVEQRVEFLLGIPVELDCSPEKGLQTDFFNCIKKTWEDNKLEYLNKELATKLMRDTEVAELWYNDVADDDYWQGTVMANDLKRPRVVTLDSNRGTALFPVFDKYHDLIAFGRSYTIKSERKNVKHFDVYTKELIYLFEQDGATWIQSTPPQLPDSIESITYPLVNKAKKIPVIYQDQEACEWADSRYNLNRRETLQSNHGDNNNRTGAPIVVLTADVVESLPEVNDQGKAIKVTGPNAKVEYLEASQAPESISLEKDNLDNDLFLFNGIIDLTVEKLSKLSLGQVSEPIFKFLFLNPHMKCAAKETIIGKAYRRRISLLKAMLIEIHPAFQAVKNLTINPKFNYYLPKNVTEELTNIKTAKDAGILSDETAAVMNPLVEDGKGEFEKLTKQKEEAAKLIPKTPVIPVNQPLNVAK